jgi:hypothetical protein
MKVVACVEWDFGKLDENIKLIYVKWLRVSLPVSHTIGSKLVETLGFIRNGWVKAVKGGRKRPLLQSLDVDGNWAIPQS